MSVLAEWYASGGSQSLVPVLEISRQGEASMFLYAGFDHIEVALETGEIVTVEPSSIQIALRDIDNSGNQRLTFGFENITSRVLNYINVALEVDEEIEIIYREYLDDDLLAPAAKPIRMVAHDGNVNGNIALIQCGHFDVVNTQFNRHRYTADKYPGIRHMS
ncbi:DUF1833 family protein [Halomonas daqingensis]|uniref:DUF1833 family protein n=1 Tax=Billgrantia desiderata TaxID=52021 RepID=A0AAW4YZK4_9GAMM|nr:DUF1833 family protein [Halomonas desiderata]MCE8053518.1 DUF1833 family protein [Halomonas desiderata]